MAGTAQYPCPEPCCIGKRSTPSPGPILIRLVSADGLRGKLIARPYKEFEFRTAIASPVSVGITDHTDLDAIEPLRLLERRYRYTREEWDEEAGQYVRLFHEVVEAPKPPPRSVPVDKIESIISSLRAQAERAASNAISHRIAEATHLSVERETTARTLTNVVVELRKLVKK